MTVFPITDIPEFSDLDRIIVVGIVGKSAYRSGSKGKCLRVEGGGGEGGEGGELGIECTWDETRRLLFLHASSRFDAVRLTESFDGVRFAGGSGRSEGFEAARRAGDFLVFAGDAAAEAARSLLLVFHLCHLVVLCSPSSVFDPSCVHLLRSVDALRAEMRPLLCQTVGSAAGPDWASQGRPCCPRALFYFDTCPGRLLGAPEERIKAFEHNLEDQIYNVLRRTRVITNVGSKSLMAIPKNEEFVYVNAGSRSRASFLRFVRRHSDLALSTGFDDDVGKSSARAPFEVPGAAAWRAVARSLTELFLSPTGEEALSPLWDALSTDAGFSRGRCSKVLPLAQAGYAENLPPHYSARHHRQRTAAALELFGSVARGPLADWYRARLEENCDRTWEGRRLCERPSLTGNPCIRPGHGDASGGEPDEGHSSGVKYIAACDCGRTKGSRDDPYTVRAANRDFYAALGKECHCGTAAERFAFPVFQPSTDDFRAASVKSGAGAGATHADGADSPVGLSQPSQEEPLSDASPSDGDGSAVPDPVGTRFRADASATDRGLVRQPSTTEYLPGMPHAESPPGLLPTFSSWSLVCLGFSSLYSHNVGLPEHLHPGFLPHLNFLVPWDRSVRLDRPSWRPSGHGARGGGRGKTHPAAITVKIFLGMEYECPRGHRFMMSRRDEVVTGNAFHKEAGNELANGEMPIYCGCPCRGNRQMVAQLTRVHVVTPKAPVHITLEPEVQPVAGGPVFVPGGDRPLRLTGAAYWVLRLPYVYSTERGPLPRPSPPLAPGSALGGRLLPGMIGVTE